ncbi:MAG TPA: phosphatase PAP2 family protein [Rhabdochlamydiaceae bacterium]|nr:phosphatase PAP2 family protein [Rhabdochlamydiaceae bacterium]
MSADYTLRAFGLDFPVLDRSTRQAISWYSWTNQIMLPLSAGCMALSRRDYAGFARLILAVVVNQLCLEFLKRVIPEVRPNGSTRSFPSGDTAAAFLGLAFILFRYGSQAMPFHLVWMTAVAVTVAVSRVLIKAHWVHDVVAGAVLGCSVVYLLT